MHCAGDNCCTRYYPAFSDTPPSDFVLNKSPPRFSFTINTNTEIAYDYCPFDAAASFGRPNYKEQCRVVAIGVCEGAVGQQVKKNGCELTTSQLSMLQDKCTDVVNDISGGPFLDDDRFERPSNKPSRRPTR